MGKFGHYGGEIEQVHVKKVRWGDAPPKYYLRNCQKCGAAQNQTNGVGLWFVGTKDSGGWRVICSQCDYLIGDIQPTEHDAVDVWNGDDKQ